MEVRKFTGRKGGAYKSLTHAFMVMEATAHVGGGPAGYLNGRIADLEYALTQDGGKPPYGVRFMGGDGVVSPLVMEVFEA